MFIVVLGVMPKIVFEPNPRPLDCCHAIPLENRQTKISCPVKNHIRDIHGLVLCVRCSCDVRELEKFFEGGEYSRNWVSRIVDCLLDDVFTLEELVGNQLTIVVLEVSQNVRHSVVD